MSSDNSEPTATHTLLQTKLRQGSGRKRDIDAGTAMEIASAAFYRIHPSRTVPQWVRNTATLGGRHDDERGQWLFEMLVFPKMPLKDGEYWHVENGHRRLMCRDPATDKRYVVLSRASDTPPTPIFRVRVDSANGQAIVEFDLDPRILDSAQYEC